jgi:hypothetical protein
VLKTCPIFTGRNINSAEGLEGLGHVSRSLLATPTLTYLKQVLNQSRVLAISCQLISPESSRLQAQACIGTFPCEMPLAFLTLDTRMSRLQATKLPSKKGLHKVDLHCWRAWRDLTYLWHLHSAGPTSTCLKHSFKSVECPCDEPPAHLTRNFIFENKFSRESFLATCHWHVSPLHPLGVSGSSPLNHTNQKTYHKGRLFDWRAWRDSNPRHAA